MKNFFIAITDAWQLDRIKTKNWFSTYIDPDLKYVEFTNKHFVCPPLFYYKVKKSFILSSEPTAINEYLGREATKRKHSSVWINDMWYSTVNLPNIEDLHQIYAWSRIRLYKSGDIEVDDTDFSELYTVPIQESRDLIMRWAEKYSILISSLCRNNKFIPTLTGGCDTRILTYFWRHNNVPSYRLLAKKETDTDIQKGLTEMRISQEVLKAIGKPDLTRIEQLPDKTETVSGIFTETTQWYKNLNNKNFVKNTMCRQRNAWENICPFIDDIYLKIKPYGLYQMRILFMLIFCPDLMDLEAYSESTYGPYYIKDRFKQEVEFCQKLLQSWKKID